MVDESVTYSVDTVDIVLKFGLFLGAIFQIVAILSILVLPRRTSDKELQESVAETDDIDVAEVQLSQSQVKRPKQEKKKKK